MPNEEYAIVLDYLPTGKSDSYKSDPVAQVIGKEHLTLLEIIPKTQLKSGEIIYIGKEERDKVQYTKRRISFFDLTSNSLSELNKAVEKIVLDNEKQFIEFFNKAGPITIRMHQLELLPGLGKKHMFNILEERRNKPFESYSDIEKRVHLMPDPVKTIIKRIMIELEDEKQKHYLFARPPSKHEEEERFRYKRKY
ncbi:MAG: DUF655 domain-containing protein [Candidatus Diapherotrites archaeon]